MSLKRNVAQQIRKVRDLIATKQDESEFVKLIPMSSSLDEENSSSKHIAPECLVNTDDESTFVNHEEVKWILSHLSHWNLEDHMAEVVYYIFSTEYLPVRKHGGIQDWTVDQVKRWVERLHFVSGKGLELGQRVEDECIDGECFTVLCQEKRLTEVLGMDYVSCMLLELIVTSWKDVSTEFVPPANFPYKKIGKQSR